ncbi:hypothetical protein Golax_020540 [Gossypium laxum]|uniref:Uncharacterized protein n=1 Tax=Gossypium laxum TaxID=34288 RepID=A0A7J9B084_9ROSI|nr:hypothetical protein [Gossypium laxum]
MNQSPIFLTELIRGLHQSQQFCRNFQIAEQIPESGFLPGLL